VLHTRRIAIHGYQRRDGLIDVEAELTDTKPYDFGNEDRAHIPAGEPLHGMAMRLTLDDALTIVACEASMDWTPYTICPGVAPNFAALAGLQVKPGFLRAAMGRVAGTAGCTHLRELLQQIATTAFQTAYSLRMKRGLEPGSSPGLVGTCYAYAEDSPVVRRRWPDLAAPQKAEQGAD
jgi:hypothetical protein